jgi:CRP-like cAMP-binding protein
MSSKKNLYLNNPRISKDLFSLLEEAGEQISISTDTSLYDMGDSSNFVYFVKEGFLESYCLYENGHQILLDTYLQGCLIGLEDALVHKMRTSNVIAISDCSLVKIPVDDALELLQSNKELSDNILSIFADQIHTLTIRLSNHACLPPKYIIIRDMLNRLWEQQQKGTKINVPARKIWASYLGLTRETLARVLSEIKNNEWIKFSNTNEIELLDLEALSEYSEHDVYVYENKLNQE